MEYKIEIMSTDVTWSVHESPFPPGEKKIVSVTVGEL
jgi:hypothetical protein